jgi:hypothetical protein
MRKWLVAAVGAAVVAAGLGCAGMGGGGHANQAACKAWATHQNGLPCMKAAQLDANQMCPATLDQNPSDMTAYYKCMETNAKCNGDIPDMLGQTSCKP